MCRNPFWNTSRVPSLASIHGGSDERIGSIESGIESIESMNSEFPITFELVNETTA